MYFGHIINHKDTAYTFLENSKEIGDYIPPGEMVYGYRSLSLSLENKIKPYTSFNYLKEGDYIIEMLKEKKINYAILEHDIFNKQDLERDNINLNENKEYQYIKENFEIIKGLNSKDYLTGSLFKKLYIYKRKELINNF